MINQLAFLILNTIVILVLNQSLLSKALPELDKSSSEPIIVGAEEEVLLDCKVKNLANYTVIWKYVDVVKSSRDKLLTVGGIRVTGDDRISVLHQPDQNLWILKISHAYPSDSGIYWCEVNSSPPSFIARVLKVTPIEEEFGDNETISFANIYHNYTDCCVNEKVPRMCHEFCQFQGLVFEGHSTDVIHGCIDYLPKIAKCLVDGRNHMPCCEKQSIPKTCVQICVGNFSLATVTEHFACMDYAAPLLSCISEGIQTLPPQPKDVSVQATSPTEIQVKWSPPLDKYKKLIEWYQINITQLDSFDDQGVAIYNDEENSNSTFSLHGLHISTKVNASLRDFKIPNLQPFTMYEVEMRSLNKHGSSLSSNVIRIVTLDPPKKTSNNELVDSKMQTIPKLPNIKKCCTDNGLTLGRCVDILCDPVRADEATLTDMMICAPWTNITFKCMASGVDHSDCCKERGVTQTCLSFCDGTIKKLDFRHFICLDHMSSYSNCILEHNGVLPSAPKDFIVPSVNHNWAILKWNPPDVLHHSVTKYHVYWRESSKDEISRYNITFTSNSPFVLDNLKPDTRYETFVSAENQYGLSQGSSRVIFSTLPLIEEDVESDQIYFYNETACCARAGMREGCLPLCNYQTKVADVIKLAPNCSDSLFILARCGAGGRDHTPCCKWLSVNPQCLNLCAGVVDSSPFLIASRCSEDLGSIIKCMKEGSQYIPSMPLDLHAMFVNSSSVHLRWKTDPESEDENVSFQVRYTKVTSDKVSHPLNHKMSLNVSKEKDAVITGLSPNTVYSIYIVATNSYGTSLPSLVLIVNTSQGSDANITSSVGPPHDIEVLLLTVDAITFKWLPPLFVLPDRTVSYIVHYKAINGTEVELMPSASQKWIKVETTYNSMIITNLTYNTQYALAIQSKTDNNELSVFSEMILVWTDAAIPATVNLPVIIPAGPVVEGSNITVLCVATGTPIPLVSVYVNGYLQKKEERRHLSFSINNVSRNLTSVTCFASNGYGRDAQSAQSSIEIRVRFKPTIVPHREVTTAQEGDVAKLQCEVSAHVLPKVTWYRDLKNQIQVQRDANIAFVITPYSTHRWINTMIIKRVKKEDAGNYICTAENDYGRSSVNVKLEVTDAKENSSFVSNCCQLQGVSPECLPACTFDVDIELARTIPQCLKDFNKLISCAADGRDHRQCCRTKKVAPQCLRWCAGLKLTSFDTCLISSSREIVSCFQEGKVLLPGPPRDLHYRKFSSSNKVIVEWEPPASNSELVQYYRVFWRPIGSRDLNRGQTNDLFFEINDLESDKMYEFVVKSGNHHGLSVYTDPLVISLRDIKSSALGNKLLKVFSGVALFAVLIIFGVGTAIYIYKNYYASRKIRSGGVSFENPSYLKEDGSVHIHDTQLETNMNGRLEDNRSKFQEDILS